MAHLRRKLLIASGAWLLAPASLLAQQSQAVRKIGFLAAYVDNEQAQKRVQNAFRKAFAEFGYEEGKNLEIAWRFAASDPDELARLAKELIELRPELILAFTTEAITAASRATRTIPIVMWGGTHPIENGFIKSLARPGGNITGAVWVGPEQSSKTFELIRELAPRAVNIALTFNPTYPFAQTWLDGYDRAARTLGMKLQYFPITRVEDIAPTLKRVAAMRPDVLFVSTEAIQSTNASLFVNFAIKRKLIIVSNSRTMVNRGAMLCYQPNEFELIRRAASYVDRILRGAKPAELPVEMPAKFQLTINMKTTRAIGYHIPASLLARADSTIE